MKVILVNDTSTFHSGSKAVIESLSSRIAGAGHELILKVPRFKAPSRVQINDCDLMIVNGEGFMRCEIDGIELDRQAITRDAMRYALRRGKMVCLVNTVWHRQSGLWREVLKNCHSVSVREVCSADEMEREFGVRPEIHPDESWFCPVPTKYDTEYAGKVVIGGIYKSNMVDESDQTSDIFSQFPKYTLSDGSWSDVVNKLVGAKHYITGQHHGVYAACKACCPFIPLRTKTHKVPGLFQWAGVEIPVYNHASAALEVEPRHDQFLKLVDFLREQLPWAIPK